MMPTQPAPTGELRATVESFVTMVRQIQGVATLVGYTDLAAVCDSTLVDLDDFLDGMLDLDVSITPTMEAFVAHVHLFAEGVFDR